MSTILSVGLIVLFGLVYLPVLEALVQVWWADPNYTHGFLIPLVAGYFVWTRKAALVDAAPAPSWWGGALLAVGLVLRIVGAFVETVGAGTGGIFVQGVSLLLTLAGLVLLFLGPGVLKLLALPLAYLLYMVPLPGGVFAMIALPLQAYASQVTVSVLRLFGLAVLREGNVITLPFITLGVVEACSGIRSLLTLLAISGTLVMFFGMHCSPWRQMLVVGAAVPIAVVSNAFRIVATGLMAHAWGQRMAEGFYHAFSGWVVFMAAFVLLSAVAFLAFGRFDTEVSG